MKTRIFCHQFSTSFIRVFSDGTATYNRKRYSSYTNARRALTRNVGFAWEVKPTK